MGMTKDQRTQLHTALLSAFPTIGEFKVLVGLALEPSIDKISPSGTLSEVVFNVLQWADAHDCIGTLVAAAREANPENPQLRAIAQTFPPVPRPPRDRVAPVPPRSWIFWSVGLVVIAVLAFWLGHTLTDRSSDALILGRDMDIVTFDPIASNELPSTTVWAPLDNAGYFTYTVAGSPQRIGPEQSLAGHTGPFLSYPLQLTSRDRDDYPGRNALALTLPRPRRLSGLIADVYYKGDPGSESKIVFGGFVAKVSNQIGFHEGPVRQLSQNTWNLLTWSPFSPVYWDSHDTERNTAWAAFAKLYPDESSFIHPAKILDGLALEKLGLQFFVGTKAGPETFRGTVYIDNVILIYQPD